MGIKLYDKLLVIYILCSWTKDTFTDYPADFWCTRNKSKEFIIQTKCTTYMLIIYIL